MQLHQKIQLELDLSQSELRCLEDECVEAIEEMQDDIKELRKEVDLQEARADNLEKENQVLKKELRKANELCTHINSSGNGNPNMRKRGNEEEEDDVMQHLIAKFHSFHPNRANSLDLGRSQINSEAKNPEPNPHPFRWISEHEKGRGRGTGTPRDPFIVTDDGRAVFPSMKKREHKRRRLDEATDKGLVSQLPELSYKGKGRAIDK
ncbi:hypothetical protein L211DRAFT_852939 [Terfezia boudieri ATCC MYA-4762]|uniref:Uncharacterized protein n=1 Tax=Terfezia boudieri ATCC MYA-4762 TaxID=1051890 RepID=A0A3N4LAS1_9PEZI|nr:hypothetical protein L211DRAFT_852939 [Terfezia boudieri ATCC MYA-4762]